MSLAWGGYQNGRIPGWAMIVVRGEHFEAEAGRQLIALGAAFQRRFGKPLIISDGYREYAEQVTNWNAWVAYRNGGPWAPQAAYYGTSNHGWGRAADLASGTQYFGTAEKRWMDANAPSYGWYPTGNGFARPEAWHFDYKGNPSIVAAGSVIELIEEEEDDMSKPIYFIASDNTGLPVGVGREDVWVRSSPGEPLRRMTQGQWSEYQNVRTPLMGDADYFFKPGAWFGLAFAEDNIVHGYNVGAHPWMSNQVSATASVDIDALVAALDERDTGDEDADLVQVRESLLAIQAGMSSLPDAVRENIKGAL